MIVHTRKSAFGLLRVAPLCGALFALGCGGGGSAGNPTGPTQSTNIGPVAVTFTGHPQAVVSGSSGPITSVGQAGASYTTLSINPAHDLNSTFLAFTRSIVNAGPEIFTLPAVQGATPKALINTTLTQYPSFAQSGLMTFLYWNGIGPTASVQTILTDGSQQKTVTTGVYAPSISPSGSTIAYVTEAGDIWTIPSAGGTATEIYNLGNADFVPPVWSPNGSQIAFAVYSSGGDHTYTMSSTGTNVKSVDPGAFAGGTVYVSSWSPDGTTLLASYNDGTNDSTAEFPATPTGSYFLLTPSTFDDNLPTFSPDGTQIAFYRNNTGGATPGIYVSNAFDTNPKLILADPGTSGTSGPVSGIAWSPFQSGETFVGAHGTITASPVNGFLVSQNGSNFASLLTFTATTPSTATLVASATTTTGAPMAYTLGADSITNISYTNVYLGAHQSIPLTSTPTTVVTVDAVTGFIDYVVPAIAGKGHPMATKSNGTSLTYTGSFSAIYDRTGKNLAPSGATTIQFDRTTGKLISFR